MDPRKQEIYVSLDIEADGPSPAQNSMMSIGAVAYNAQGKEMGRFYCNLLPLPGHSPSPKTMAWWALPENEVAWRALQSNQTDPGQAMADFSDWLDSISGEKIMVAGPAAYDAMWIQSYAQEFGVNNPAFTRWIDIRSYIMGSLGTSYGHSTIARLPDAMKSSHPHTHIASDDATEQGETFVKLLQERKARNEGKGRSVS